MRKAIIIGAGPAGLTAAYELLTKSDILPIVIEQDSQVGGLSKTIDFEGNKIDIGGHRFFSKSDKVLDWWLSFMPLHRSGASAIELQYQNKTKAMHPTAGAATVPDEEQQMLLRPRSSRIYYQGHFYDYPLKFTPKTLKQLGIRRVLSFAVSYMAAKLKPVHPEISLEDFFRNRFGTALYHTFFEEYTKKVWGVPCSQLPASWGRQRVKGLDIGKLLQHAFRSFFSRPADLYQKKTATSLIEQFLYPKYGPGQLWDKVAAAIIEKGGEIRLNCRVTSIQGNGANAIQSVLVASAVSGEETTVHGDYFFSTMPVREFVHQLSDLPVPPSVQSAANSLEYRDFLIVGILLSHSNLNTEDNWIYLQDRSVKAGRLQLFHNWSPGMVADPFTQWLGVEYFCNETDAFWQKTDADIAAFAIEEMAGIELIDKNAVRKTLVVKVKKAYPSYFGGYSDFATVKSFLDTIKNAYPIGRNGMHRYNNTDHSMLTAMAAVDNIIQGRTNNANVWEINTDDEYHEEAKA